MARKHSSFVILADMRTGSNALEEQLAAYDGLDCHGELFNPHFVGRPKASQAFGLDMAARDGDPAAFLDAMRAANGRLPGFRLFSDHDPRVLDLVLSDRGCAKIVLTRDPLESYVSLKIARQTGQWWLGDLRSARTGTARFDMAEFMEYRAARAAYLARIRERLQTTGQTAFWISQRQLGDADVIAGLARYLGAGDRGAQQRRGRRQNPVPMSEKVENFAEMQRALAAEAAPAEDDGPDIEPSRGPNVPSYVASRTLPLLYMPVKCASDLAVRNWLAEVDGGSADALESGFSRKSLRSWKRKTGRHRSFTVVDHPAARAHDAFCRFILPLGDGSFAGIRATLGRSYDVPLPEDPDDPAYDADAHRAAFLAFLRFLKGNLSGQTAIRVDSAWASQTAVVQGLAQFGLPDLILRAADLAVDLERLSECFGRGVAFSPPAAGHRHALADIYDEAVERAARAAYQRDYMMFGFGAWSEGQAA